MKRKVTYFLVLIFVSLYVASYLYAQKESKVLIVYFSRVGSSHSFENVDAVSSASLPEGNTILMAQMIHKVTGGKMHQIVTVSPYPSKYRETTQKALKEKNRQARPRLKSKLPDIKDYDTVFIGYPNWWYTIPMPVATFLESHDFKGKTIVPFCTHEGSGFGSSVSDIQKLCPTAKVVDGLAIRGGLVKESEERVLSWLKSLNYE